VKKPSGVIGFVGQPGCGKTYLMKQRFWDSQRVIVYNFASGFGPVGQCRANQNPLPGFVFVYSVPDLIQVLRQTGRGRVRVCFSPVRAPFDKTEVFNDVCKLVCDFSRSYGATVFAVDEVWNAQTASWSPEHFNECFCQWRHYDLTLMWTAQRPSDTDAALRGMSTEIYAGRVTTEIDVKAVRRCGFPEDLVERLPSLPNRVFIHRFETGEWRMEK
jgi:hypothetical protein